MASSVEPKNYKLHLSLSEPNCIRRSRLLTSNFLLLTSFFCLLTSALCLRAAAWRYQVVEVKPHVFVWAPEDIRDQEADPEYDRAGSAGFVITDAGVVVINTTNSPFHAREILYEIRARTEQPVKYVINTDGAPDHFLGNEVFADLKATLFSTAEAQSQMRAYQQQLVRRLDGDDELSAAMRSFHPTPATETSTDDWTLHLGGRDLKLISVPAGPSPGTAVVYLPDAKVLFLGALYENGMIPRLDSADLKGWIEFLHKVATWDVDVYIPGHGPAGGKRELAEFQRFLEFLASRPGPTPAEPAPHPKWR